MHTGRARIHRASDRRICTSEWYSRKMSFPRTIRCSDNVDVEYESCGRMNQKIVGLSSHDRWIQHSERSDNTFQRNFLFLAAKTALCSASYAILFRLSYILFKKYRMPEGAGFFFVWRMENFPFGYSWIFKGEKFDSFDSILIPTSHPRNDIFKSKYLSVNTDP